MVAERQVNRWQSIIGENVAQQLIGRAVATVGEVAGDHHRHGVTMLGLYLFQAIAKAPLRVEPPEFRSGRNQMDIGDLNDLDHQMPRKSVAGLNGPKSIGSAGYGAHATVFFLA